MSRSPLKSLLGHWTNIKENSHQKENRETDETLKERAENVSQTAGVLASEYFTQSQELCWGDTSLSDHSKEPQLYMYN